MLYSSKDQLPDLLERYIIGVLALQYEIGILRVDGDAVNISARVEELATLYNFVIQPMSAGAPQENGFAEKAVGDATRLARAFMLGAPHLQKNLWGLSYGHAGKVNQFIQKPSRDGKTPYHIIHNRIPDYRRTGMHVFGCPSQMKPLGKQISKMTGRTIDSHYVGVDSPSLLMQRVSDKKVMRVSPKKVRCHEAMYCMRPFVSMESLENLVSLVDDDEEFEYDADLPISVPSIKVLKPGRLFDPFSNQREREKTSKGVPSDNPEPVEVEFSEEHQEIGEESDRHLKELREYFLAERVAPDIQEGIVKLLEQRVPNVGVAQQANQDEVDQDGRTESKKREVELPVDSGGLATRSMRRKVNQTDSSVSESTTQEDDSLDNSHASDHVLEKLQVMRPPMSKVPIGSRVKIESTRFDSDSNKYSDNAPPYTHGTVHKRCKGGLIEVLWDGDTSTVRSHNSHLFYSDEHESGEEEQSELMNENDEPVSVYTTMCMQLGLPKWQEPFKTLAAIETSVSKSVVPIDTATAEILPCSTWEALVSPQWRKWIEAIRKEHLGWIAADVYDIVNKCEMKPGEMCVDIKEIFSVKRTGECKYRGALRGDQLRKDVDYHNTFIAAQ